MEIRTQCSNCGQEVVFDDSGVGQTVACPSCSSPILLTRAQPTATPLSIRPAEIQTNVKQGASIGGWVCFVLAAVFMFIPIPTWFIYGPLFLASFILSIVAMSQKRLASGLALLLANVIGAPILFVIALAVGIATWAGAVKKINENQKARISVMRLRTNASESVSVKAAAATTNAALSLVQRYRRRHALVALAS